MGGGKDAVVAGEVLAGRWDEGGEAPEELVRGEGELGPAIAEAPPEGEDGVAAVIDGQPGVGDGGAGSVATEALEGVAVTGVDGPVSMEGVAGDEGDSPPRPLTAGRGSCGEQAGLDGSCLLVGEQVWRVAG